MAANGETIHSFGQSSDVGINRAFHYLMTLEYNDEDLYIGGFV